MTIRNLHDTGLDLAENLKGVNETLQRERDDLTSRLTGLDGERIVELKHVISTRLTSWANLLERRDSAISGLSEQDRLDFDGAEETIRWYEDVFSKQDNAHLPLRVRNSTETTYRNAKASLERDKELSKELAVGCVLKPSEIQRGRYYVVMPIKKGCETSQAVGHANLMETVYDAVHSQLGPIVRKVIEGDCFGFASFGLNAGDVTDLGQIDCFVNYVFGTLSNIPQAHLPQGIRLDVYNTVPYFLAEGKSILSQQDYAINNTQDSNKFALENSVNNSSSNHLEIVLPATKGINKGKIPGWKRHSYIPILRDKRLFFPGYKVQFFLETDIGHLITNVNCGSYSTYIGHPYGGIQMGENLRPWYAVHQELQPGSILEFTRLKEKKEELPVYKLDVKK